MKFHHFQGFEKHLKEVSNEQLGHQFAIVSNSWVERDVLVKLTLKRLSHLYPNYLVETVDFSEGITKVLSSLEYSLFGSSKIVVIKNIDKLLARDLKAFEKVLLGQDPVIFTFTNPLALKGFYPANKKHLVAVDLTLEKPWERQDRLLKWALGYLKKFNVQIQHKDLLELVSAYHSFDLIKHELDKLALFAGSNQKITKEHIDLLCNHSVETTAWKFSESLIFNTSKDVVREGLETCLQLVDLATLFGAFRYHLELALLMKAEGSASHVDSYKNIHKKTLDKYKLALEKLCFKSLSKSYQCLSNYEKLSRLSNISPKTLLNGFVSNLLLERGA